ncbi:MAG: matrixin family metalloprotease, partial [Thermoplasmata archaeon]
PPSGTDLVTVAAHEFGHALGLKHSNVRDALMFAYYGGLNRSLDADDIAGIRALYGRRPPRRFRLDHFKVYEVSEQKVPPLCVTLEDQFGSEKDVRPEGLTHFAAPVIKNDQKVLDPSAHLTWYRAYSRAPIRRVEVSNQLNPGRRRQRLYVKNPEYLLVPTQKEEYRSRFPEGLDHYRCYRVVRSRPLEARVRLRDQFGEEETVIGRARYFCVPVSKDGAEIKNSKDHLVAYRIRERVGHRQEIRIANQFTGYHPIVVALTTSAWLCVPSRKLRVAPLEKEA